MTATSQVSRGNKVLSAVQVYTVPLICLWWGCFALLSRSFSLIAVTLLLFFLYSSSLSPVLQPWTTLCNSPNILWLFLLPEGDFTQRLNFYDFFKLLRKRGRGKRRNVCCPQGQSWGLSKVPCGGGILSWCFSHFHLGSKSEVLTFMLHY